MLRRKIRLFPIWQAGFVVPIKPWLLDILSSKVNPRSYWIFCKFFIQCCLGVLEAFVSFECSMCRPYETHILHPNLWFYFILPTSTAALCFVDCRPEERFSVAFQSQFPDQVVDFSHFYLALYQSMVEGSEQFWNGLPLRAKCIYGDSIFITV